MRCGDHEIVERLHIDVDRGERAGPDVDARQAPRSGFEVRRDEPRFVGERPRRGPEDPLGTTELRGHRVDGFHLPGAHTVEIPPIGAIRHEVQRAVGRPPGLEDRLAAAAGRQCRRPEPAVRADLRGPQLGAVPRHVGMAPRQPRQPRAVGTEAGARIEIVTRGDHRHGRRRTVERQAHERVDGFAIRRRVILAHADQPRARGVGRVIRVAEPAGRRERLWHAAPLEPVHSLVGEFGEVGDPLGHGVGGPAVLVDAGPHVGSLGRDVRDPALGAARDHDTSAAIFRPPFEPIEVVAVEHDPAQ